MTNVDTAARKKFGEMLHAYVHAGMRPTGVSRPTRSKVMLFLVEVNGGGINIEERRFQYICNGEYSVGEQELERCLDVLFGDDPELQFKRLELKQAWRRGEGHVTGDDWRGTISGLTHDERATLFAVAAAHEPLGASHMRGLLEARGVECAELLTAKGVLIAGPHYALPPDASEPVLEQLCALIADEVQKRKPELLARAPLLDTREPEAAIQLRLERVVRRVLRMLEGRRLHEREIAELLEAMLGIARSKAGEDNYLAGNIVNLLVIAKRDLSGLDLSGLHLSHAYLRNAELRGADLCGARFEHCVFADIFGSIWQVGFRGGSEEVLASSASGTVQVWSIATWRSHKGYGSRGDAHCGWSFGFAVRADEQEVASAGGDAEIRIWRADGKLADILRGHTSRVRAVAFLSDGSLVSCSEDRRVLHWQRSFGPTEPVELYQHQDRATTLAASPDGRFVMSGASRGEVVILDREGTAPPRRSTPHAKEVRSVRISSDGTMAVSSGDDGRVLVWDLAKAAVVGQIQPPMDLPAKAACFVGPGSKTIAVGTDDGRISIWEAPFRGELHGWHAHKSLIRSLAATTDGTMITSGGDDQTVLVWRLARDGSDPTLLRSYTGYSAEVRALAFAPSGTLATAHDDGLVRFWDAATGAEAPPYSIEGHKGRIWSLAFHEAGRVLVTGAEDGKVRAWRIGNRLPFWTGEGHEYRVFAVAARDTPTPRIASGGSDATVRIWSSGANRPLETLAGAGGHTRRVRDVTFNHTGRLLASAGEDQLVIVWEETEGGWRRLRSKQDTTPVTTLRFSSDGEELFYGTDGGRLVAWRHTGDESRATALSQKPILSIALSPDGTRLVAGCEDGQVYLVDAGSLDRITSQGKHSDWVEQVAYSPDGAMVVSGSDDETVRRWDSATLAQVEPPIKASPPYDGLRIRGVTGLGQIDLERLRALGATDQEE